MAPNADKATGTIMQIHTLFPSSTNNTGGSKGGIILIQLRLQKADGQNIAKLKLMAKDDRKNNWF